MKRKSLQSVNCSIAQTLDVVGDPWTMLIIRDAFFGLRRFDELQRSLDIPRATLSARLHALVDRGVLERRQLDDAPNRHEYHLTSKGRALGPLLVAMLQWGDEWSDLPEPPITLVDGEHGTPLELDFVDRATGRRLRDVRVERRRNTARDRSEAAGRPRRPSRS